VVFFTELSLSLNNSFYLFFQCSPSQFIFTGYTSAVDVDPFKHVLQSFDSDIRVSRTVIALVSVLQDASERYCLIRVGVNGYRTCSLLCRVLHT
jgi:hypothetical protein